MNARHFHFSLFGGVQERPKPQIDVVRIGRVAWVGLTLAVVGWAMLLGEIAITDFVWVQDPPAMPPMFRDDFIDVAKTLIYSGIGLALVGSLQTGFGALNRFFEAVLVRSGQKAQPQALAVPASEAFKHETMVDATPRPRRPYRIFPDGSVEVETIVGSRRFRSMSEARDFI